jgi:iron complex transport system substrate-binding protein
VHLAGFVAALAVAGAVATTSKPSPRVYSLDQCADQYVLALSPRDAIVGLSRRAGDADSYLRARSRGLPQGRATSEAVLAARPDVVVRYWGGDARLAADLRGRGVKVVPIDDATNFAGVRANIQRVAAALEQRGVGEALIARMNERLLASQGAWGGAPALYLTSGGYTAGDDTLVDAMLKAAGLRNLSPGSGFRAVSLERLVFDPPSAIIEGFFDLFAQAYQWWNLGRQPVVRSLARGRAIVSLPGALLGCPAWFAADGAAAIAKARRS